MHPRQPVFDTYWQTAAERQAIFFRKLAGEPPPYSADPIFDRYKFCNVYRAADRVSQFLIKHVIYSHPANELDTLFRIFLFRLLNKIETWQELEKELGRVSLDNFSQLNYGRVLEKLRRKDPIYGNAFILCATKAFGYDRKHANHLALLDRVFRSKTAGQILISASLKELFFNLRQLPLIGDFMAYQLAIDFNYSEVFNFSENDYTVAGPGAIRGIRKCFVSTGGKSPAEVIRWMVAAQDKEFSRLGLKFKSLFGRPMHAIDCQGWFCELDKYSRVRFPELKSNRVRIKTTYKPNSKKLSYFFPPKWGIKPSSS